MKKMIIPIITLFLTFIIGFGSISLAGPPHGTPGLANSTQMESFSGTLNYSAALLLDDELVLEFDEIRHISLSLRFETLDSDLKVSMHTHIGGDNVFWYGNHAAENQLDTYHIVREEIDTDYLSLYMFSYGPGTTKEGTLYYNITTTYPAAP